MHKWLMEKGKCLKTEMENHGIDNLTKADLEEAYYYSKILKNLMCLEKDGKIVEAMENAENEDNMDMIEQYEDYPEKRYYQGQPRDSKGRYMSRRSGRGRRMYNDSMMPMDYEMDMDMYNKYDPKTLRDIDRKMGRLYFSEPMTMNSQGNMTADSKNAMHESNYDRAKRTFTEGKMMHNSGSQEDNTANMKSLETIFNVLDAEMKELAPMMSQAEKTFSKQRITNLNNMVK